MGTPMTFFEDPERGTALTGYEMSTCISLTAVAGAVASIEIAERLTGDQLMDIAIELVKAVKTHCQLPSLGRVVALQTAVSKLDYE